MDQLSQTFSALADPTRRAILARLADGGATVGDLAEPFDMSLPAVSRHLKVLTEAGLIERIDRGTVAALRACAARAFAPPPTGSRSTAGSGRRSFDQLDAFLKRTDPKPTKGKRNARRKPSIPIRCT